MYFFEGFMYFLVHLCKGREDLTWFWAPSAKNQTARRT